ncbi:MAG: uroporphyrinogen decarboxylase family protein, partial [Rhodospirillales bacterium]|nr:uroporphyrinogen decarboxylase family protein [Rhodospirillales bacterium]
MDKALDLDRDKSGEQLHAERIQRMADAVALKPTDRVPFSLFAHYWAATYAGISFKDAMYDADAMMQATSDAVRYLQPDDYGPPANIVLGPTMEIMDFRQIEWPGHGVADDVAFQYLDKEYMAADEYDDYIYDPTGFFLRTYMPRLAGAFEVFAKLPDF